MASWDAYKRVTDGLTAAATIVLAGTLVVTAMGYLREERTETLNRTLEVLAETNRSLDREPQHTDALKEFRDRWQVSIPAAMPANEAQQLFDISVDPGKNEALYHTWDVARKHLNALETLAFAYEANLIDREIAAADACVLMARSYFYFRPLIQVFGDTFGSWQAIGRVVGDMRTNHAEDCKDLHLPQDAMRAAS